MADVYIEELKEFVNSIMVIPNDIILNLADKEESFKEALHRADDIIYFAIKGILNFIKNNEIDLFSFGKTMISVSCKGNGKVEKILKKAISHPLLKAFSLKQANAILFNITSNIDLTQEDIKN